MFQFSHESASIYTEKNVEQKSYRGGTVPVNKTLKRGAKFQEERYLCSDCIFTQVRDGKFLIQSKYEQKRNVPDQVRTLSQVGTSSHMAYAM